MSSRMRGIEIVVIIALALIVLGIFSGFLWGGWRWLGMGLHGPLPAFFLLGAPFMFGLGSLLQIAIAVWVGTDASRRGMTGLLWGLLVLFTPVIGLLVYLIVVHAVNGGSGPVRVRSRSCSGCGKHVQDEFKLCPYCGEPVGAAGCPGCRRPTETGWKVCPYCSTALQD